MTHHKAYFFCGIGGSGMLPLALIIRGKGIAVGGSDRSLDQGRTAAKFAYLRASGVALYPQDGSGVTDPGIPVVISTAVEEAIPDVQAARRLGAPLLRRADLLAELFNAAAVSVGVAGTSGKSTTTGMIGWILYDTGKQPTVMNGAVMKNFVGDDTPFASSLVGAGEIFVSEVDESDGSIALYTPDVAVVNNIALDHKSLEELRALFRGFVGKSRLAVLNLDNEETSTLAVSLPRENKLTYSLHDSRADFLALNIAPAQDGVGFTLRSNGGDIPIRMQVPGRHNVANALAALAAASACGVAPENAARALERFTGIRRRLEYVGTSGGVTVIDDFAHNPDKLTATLATLHDFPGRLLLMFQPHGFGPLKLMKDAFIACLAENMRPDDVLIMPDPVYFGGTVDRSVSSADIVAGVKASDREAYAFETRAQCGEKLLSLAKSGDRIVVMGARDDTLSTFAADLLTALSKN